MRPGSGSRAARFFGVLALTVAASGCTLAAADAFYRWTDEQGKVHYADRPPKGFTGAVKRIEVDPSEKAAPPAAPASGTAPAASTPPGATEPTAQPAQSDLLAKRRATRARLEADLARARAKLAQARKALAEGSDPKDDERQVVQQRNDPKAPHPGPDSNSNGGMLGSGGGMYGMAPRSNCRTEKGANGKPVTVCPTLVPTEGYYKRIDELEKAVRDAEAEVAAAELAYRRGVD